MKREIITLCEKYVSIKSLDQGVGVTDIAKTYGIAKSTLFAS